MTRPFENRAAASCNQHAANMISRVSQTEDLLEHIRLHLSLLCNGDLRKKKFLFCMILPVTREIRTKYSALRTALPWLRDYQSEGFGAFVLVNENEGSRYRSRDNIVAVRAVWCDLDGIDINKIEFPLAPSLILSSGSLHSYHVYWFTDRYNNLDLDTADRMNGDMVARFGSDPRACDLARVLRLAGTQNTKPGIDQPCRIIGGSGRRYSGDELRNAFPPLQPAPKPYAANGTRPRPTDKPVGWITEEERIESALAAIDPDDDYRTWIAIGAGLHKHFHGGDTGLRLWEAWSQTGGKHQMRRTRDGNVSECVQRWRSFKKPRAGIGTVFYHAKTAGWLDPRVPGCTKGRGS